MSMLKLGLVGFGKIARRMYVPHIQANPEAELVAISDTSREVLELAQEEFSISQVFTDYREMLGVVDAVCVCAPNLLHASVTIDALRHGKPVLVEKPMAVTLEEAQGMVAAGEESGVVLMVNQSQRFSPLFVKAKEVVESGVLGDIVGVRSVFGHAGPVWWSPESSWFFDKAVAGFGPLADLGIHRVDMVRHLVDMEYQEVFSAVSHMRDGQGDVEDNAVIVGKLENGALASVMVSWTIHGRVDDTMDIYGSKGTLKIKYGEDRVLFADMEQPIADSSIAFSVPRPYEPAYEQGEWLFFSGIDNFIDAIQGKAECAVPGSEGLRSLEVILAAAKAADSGCTVKLPL